MTEQEMIDADVIWHAGAYSASRDVFVPHLVVNAEHPKGRWTRDKRQAELWAQEDADHFNQDANSGAVDWVAHVEIGPNPFSEVDASVPLASNSV